MILERHCFARYPRISPQPSLYIFWRCKHISEVFDINYDTDTPCIRADLMCELLTARKVHNTIWSSVCRTGPRSRSQRRLPRSRPSTCLRVVTVPSAVGARGRSTPPRSTAGVQLTRWTAVSTFGVESTENWRRRAIHLMAFSRSSKNFLPLAPPPGYFGMIFHKLNVNRKVLT